MSIKAIAHVCLRCADLNAALRFYRDMLGIEPQFNFIRNGTLTGFYLKVADGMYVEIFEAPDVSGVQHNQAAPLSHFCLQTDDIKGLRQKLADNGYEPTEILMGADRSWQFWVRDPAGIRMEFHEYTPESSQITGQDVELARR